MRERCPPRGFTIPPQFVIATDPAKLPLPLLQMPTAVTQAYNYGQAIITARFAEAANARADADDASEAAISLAASASTAAGLAAIAAGTSATGVRARSCRRARRRPARVATHTSRRVRCVRRPSQAFSRRRQEPWTVPATALLGGSHLCLTARPPNPPPSRSPAKIFPQSGKKKLLSPSGKLPDNAITVFAASVPKPPEARARHLSLSRCAFPPRPAALCLRARRRWMLRPFCRDVSGRIRDSTY